MIENKVAQLPRKNRVVRRPSSNTSISSTDSLILVKKKFMLQSRLNTNLLGQQKPCLTDNISSKLKVCEGQRLSYEVMKSNSKQKKAQFLLKYANDPFMRIKFQKSVQKFNRSKSRQLVQRQGEGINNISKKDINIVNKSYTTFREQIRQQSQKTVKLIHNCKQLVQELKKNRLIQGDKQKDKQSQSIVYTASRFHGKRYQGAFTDRV